jgi:hypothetical protein
MASNGEVEGPPRSVHQAPRAHIVFLRPQGDRADRSRTPPTIVRRDFGCRPLNQGDRPVKAQLRHVSSRICHRSTGA